MSEVVNSAFPEPTFTWSEALSEIGKFRNVALETGPVRPDRRRRLGVSKGQRRVRAELHERARVGLIGVGQLDRHLERAGAVGGLQPARHVPGDVLVRVVLAVVNVCADGPAISVGGLFHVEAEVYWVT
jgi:hypothetical protein